MSYPFSLGVDRPLRIAIVTENFLPNYDGVTRTLARLLSYLRAHGHEALVLGPESGMTSYEDHKVCGTVGIPLYFYPGLSLNFFRPRFLRKLREFEPDVIHYVDPIRLCAQAQPIIEYAFSEVAAVSSYHTNLARYAGAYGYHWLVSTMWALQRRLHGHCEATFCPSPSTQSMLFANGFDGVKLWPRGVDTSLFNPSRRSAARRKGWQAGDAGSDCDGDEKREKVVLSYVGRISYEKNIGLLIEAFRGLEMSARSIDPAFPGCKLVLVGDGPARAEVEGRTRDAKVAIEFLGHRSGIELAECYASSDIFAFPSHSETFGNVVLEALASGLPVVGLRAEGVCDLVQDGDTGYLLDIAALPGAQLNECEKGNRVPVNAQALLAQNSPVYNLAVNQYRELLLALVLDQTRREEMGRNAMAYAQTRTWDEAMGMLMRGYQGAAFVTQRNRSMRVSRALSRSSSTSTLASTLSRKGSLIDVRVEDPPSPADDHDLGAEPTATTSAKLLFGRPPIRRLLKRSTRSAIRESISYKWQTLEVAIVARSRRKGGFEARWRHAWMLFALFSIWVLVVEPYYGDLLRRFLAGMSTMSH